MDKLLHERLRDVKDDSETIKVSPGLKVLMSKKFCNELADEINKYYIPRPRFDDGEPAKFGEELENGKRIANIAYHIGGRCTINDTATWQGTCESDYELKNNETLKRPTPKVLDADGVEIKVGDTVWASRFNCSFTVDRISKNRKGETLVMVEEMGSGLNPDYCYHEKPVFDAEGVRICKGDTVYDVDGINTEPMRVLSYGDALVNVMSKSGIEKDYEFNELTHREPDSLEKLRDAMKGSMSSEVRIYADRLTALIERNAQ